MVFRHRIKSHQRFVIGGGTGGGGAGGTVRWGPDFGEPGGGDGVTFTAGAELTMPSLRIQNTQTVGVNLTMPSLRMSNTQTAGVHLSGTAVGAPFWQSVATSALSSAASSIVINKPSGVVAGDLLLAVLGLNDLTPPDFTTPTGWTLIRTGEITLNKAVSYYRIADGTEGSSFTFSFTGTTARATGAIHRINATDATTPINASAGAVLPAADLNPDPVSPAVTTTTGNCLVFAVLFHDHAALSQSHTPPASHVERADFQSTSGALVIGQTSATRVFSATGSTGTATHDCTETVATDAIMFRIAVAPGPITLAA